MNKLVGVYGTLRKGERNYAVMGDSTYLTTVFLYGYQMYGGPDYPAIIKGAPEESVVLEIFRVSNACIAADIDRLEGFDRKRPNDSSNFYTLRYIQLDSFEEPIEVYTFDHAPSRANALGPKIVSGDWSKRTNLIST